MGWRASGSSLLSPSEESDSLDWTLIALGSPVTWRPKTCEAISPFTDGALWDVLGAALDVADGAIQLLSARIFVDGVVRSAS